MVVVASTPTVEEMLGNQGVTESNMMQYLGIIEQRTIEILQTYAQSQVGRPASHWPFLVTVGGADSRALVRQMGNGADGNMGLPGGGAVKQPPPPKPSVLPPASDDFSSGTDTCGSRSVGRRGAWLTGVCVGCCVVGCQARSRVWRTRTARSRGRSCRKRACASSTRRRSTARPEGTRARGRTEAVVLVVVLLVCVRWAGRGESVSQSVSPPTPSQYIKKEGASCPVQLAQHG